MIKIAGLFPKMRLSRYQLWFVLGAVASALVFIGVDSGTRPFEILASVFALAGAELAPPGEPTTSALDVSSIIVGLHRFFLSATIAGLAGTVGRVLVRGRFAPSAVAEESIYLLRGATLPSLWLLLLITIQLAPHPVRLQRDVDWMVPLVVATGVLSTMAILWWLTREETALHLARPIVVAVYSVIVAVVAVVAAATWLLIALPVEAGRRMFDLLPRDHLDSILPGDPPTGAVPIRRM